VNVECMTLINQSVKLLRDYARNTYRCGRPMRFTLRPR
jgi:hypothetical protein